MTNAIAKTNTNFEIPMGYICTVDTSTDEGKLDVMMALNGSDSLSTRMGETLIVRDIVTTSGVRSQSGEACTNVYLILNDGTALFSQSGGVERSAKTLVALYTKQTDDGFVCDFGDGIAVKCIEQTLRNGNTLKTLVPVRG